MEMLGLGLGLAMLALCSSLAPPSMRSLATMQLSSHISQAIRREDFPILNVQPYPNKKLVYLDSGASSQKPIQVLQRMDEYYRTSHSNVHRGAHALAMRATEQYEWSREQIQKFIHAEHREEIVFTRGATEAINLVAQSYGTFLRPGDEIVLTVMEHHSNLVPWQMLAQRSGAVLRFVPLDSNQAFDMKTFESFLSSKTRLVALVHASNVLGSVNPVQKVIAAAHAVGAKVLLDACQSTPHMPLDVQALDVDFLVASGHKMCGPTGIGFLYARLSLLEQMPPVLGGGEMIDRVTLEHSTYAKPPYRFEAGTPAIAEAIGLGAACEYLTNIGMERIQQHEQALGQYLYSQLKAVGMQIYGPTHDRTGLCAFNHPSIHPSDLAAFLDQDGVALRSGHHCAQPLHALLGVPGSLRASLYFYNNQEDIDIFISKLQDSIALLSNLS
jgi:cysteine desulfurase / selenocysteine lyase